MAVWNQAIQVGEENGDCHEMERKIKREREERR